MKKRKLVKIATAGSVDDGKSTLIGRLLYETNSLSHDKLEAIEHSSRQKGYDYLDFSLATDGLVAEREQGITIDVAHIYLSTDNTNFIIADTPGHVEYTRNMVTGASTSQVAIILIDARKGVTEQTYRHFFISSLLRLKHVVVAINKMDLVGYEASFYYNIKHDFEILAAKSSFTASQISFIPISALKGENIASKSTCMPWYDGTSLLEHLESEDIVLEEQEEQARFQVQYVIRPKTEAYHDFRGFSGKLHGGFITKGDAVTILPSRTQTRIKAITFFDKHYDGAPAGASVTLMLEDELNLSRGDMIVKNNELPYSVQNIHALVCHLNKKSLKIGEKYILQHGVQQVTAKIEAVHCLANTDFTISEKADELKLNEIGYISLKLSKPIYIDTYVKHRTNGSYILIDYNSFDTASIGFIQEFVPTIQNKN